MPYADEPGAYRALLGPDVELRRTEYDLEAAAERIRATGWPDGDEFIAENLRRPHGRRGHGGIRARYRARDLGRAGLEPDLQAAEVVLDLVADLLLDHGLVEAEEPAGLTFEDELNLRAAVVGLELEETR